MGNGVDIWPSLASSTTLAGFRGSSATDGATLDVDAPSEVEALAQSDALDGILGRLEAIDADRAELRKETRWMSVRILALERSLRQSHEANEAVVESLERCFVEVQQYEDRLSPRLAQLELDGSRVVSQIAAINQDVLSARVENRAASSEFDGWVAEILGLIHEAKLMAVQARGSAEVTADRADQMILDLRHVESTLDTTVETTHRIAGDVQLVRDESLSERQELAGTVNAVQAGIEALSTEVSESSGLSAEISTLAERVADVSRDVERTIEQSAQSTSRMAGEVADVAGKVSLVEAQLAESIDGSEEKIEALSDAMEARVADVASTVAELSDELDAALEITKLAEDSLLSSIGEVSDNVAAQGEELGAIDLRLSADVASVVERVSVVEVIAQDAADGVGEVSGEVSKSEQRLAADLARSRDAVDGKVDDLVGRLSALVERADATEVEVASVAEDMSVVAGEVSGVGDRVALVAEDVSVVAGEVSGVGDRVASVVERVSVVEVIAQDAADGAAEVSGEVVKSEQRLATDLAKSRDAIDGKVDDLVGRLSALVERADATEVDVASVAEDVSVVAGEVSGVGDRVASVVERVSVVEVIAQDAADGAAEVSGLLGESEQRLSADVASVADDVAGVSTALGATGRDVEQLSTDLAESSDALAQRVEDLVARLGALVERSDATEVEVASIVDDLSAVGKQLENLSFDVASVTTSAESTSREVVAMADDSLALEKLIGEGEALLAARISGVAADVAETSGSLAAADGRVDDLVVRLSALVERSDATEVEVASVAEGLSVVAEDVLVVASDVSVVGGEVSGVADRVASVVERVSVVEVIAQDAADGVDAVGGEVAKSEQRLSTDLASARDAAVLEIEQLTDDVRSAIGLAKEVEAMAEKANDRADYSAKSGDELRADFDEEVVQRAEELRRVEEDTRIRLNALVDQLRSYGLISEESDADRHRARWNDHLRVHTEMRRMREDKQ